MKPIRQSNRLSALLLLVLILQTLTHSLVLPSFELNSLQESVAREASLLDNDNDEQTDEGDFKPPKHSFTDYSSFFSPNFLIPSYNPSMSELMTHEPFQAQPQVYLKIFVPPDGLA